jgi:hypothetical protein
MRRLGLGLRWGGLLLVIAMLATMTVWAADSKPFAGDENTPPPGTLRPPTDIKTPPSTKTSEEVGPNTIVFTAQGVTVRGTPLTLPCPQKTVFEVLGQPTRTLALANTISVWDDLGVYVYVKPNTTDVFCFAVGFQPGTYRFSPKANYQGRIQIAEHFIDKESKSGDLQAAGFRSESYTPTGSRIRLGSLAVNASLTGSGGTLQSIAIEPSLTDR